MKATPLKQNERTTHLKVVNNSIGKKNNLSGYVNRLYINTLTPCFNYINHTGEVVSPEKFVLL